MDAKNVPAHVAIIMDGNGRWAKSKGLPRTLGHAKGAQNLEDMLYIADELGVKYLTVYALFSLSVLPVLSLTVTLFVSGLPV